MTPSEQIRPPAPEDFQITDADISQFEDREVRLKALFPQLSFGLSAATVVIVGIVQTDWKWMLSDGLRASSTYIGLFMMLLGWTFLSFLGSFFVAVVVYPLSNFVLNRTPNAAAVLRYRRAVTEFRAWLDRSRRGWWSELSGLRFEQELARLFRALGWDATPTRASGDGGIDIVGKRDGVKFIVQCKNHKPPIGPSVVRELYGTLLASDAQRAILASVSGFTKGVKEFVEGKPIELIDLDWIIYRHMQLDASWKSLMHPAEKRSLRFKPGLSRKS